jgi:FKBP12-rapamycin complex-associated protein
MVILAGAHFCALIGSVFSRTQALLVSSELIRVAILWHEMWHEGLEDASRLWFGEENFEGMYETLEPLHQMIKKGPETLREISFIQSYGQDLQVQYNMAGAWAAGTAFGMRMFPRLFWIVEHNYCM